MYIADSLHFPWDADLSSFQAKSLGFSSAPRVFLRHPVSDQTVVCEGEGERRVRRGRERERKEEGEGSLKVAELPN